VAISEEGAEPAGGEPAPDSVRLLILALEVAQAERREALRGLQASLSAAQELLGRLASQPTTTLAPLLPLLAPPV
jgi:hypothetical protein